MNDHSKITEKLHSAITLQWQEAINADTPTEWSYTSGVLAGFIAHDSANHDLLLLHQIAAIRSTTTTPAPVEAGASLLEQPQYAGLLEIITEEWGFALCKSLNPTRAWLEVQQRLAGMADYALLLNHDDAAFEELRALSSLAQEHRLNSEVRHG